MSDMTAETKATPTAGEDIFAEPTTAVSAPAVIRATDLTGVAVLKHDDMYLLCDAYGDIHPDGRGLGLYHGDTRFLSLFDMRLNGVRPIVLRTGNAAGYRGTLHLSNADLWHQPANADDPEIVLRRHSLGVVRERFVADGFFERIRIDNFTTSAEPARISLRLDADYADIFEVRGMVRTQRGQRLSNHADGAHITFFYRGLDDVERRTHVALAPAAVVRSSAEGGPVELELEWQLPAGGSRTLEIRVWTEVLNGDAGAAASAAGDGTEPAEAAEYEAAPPVFDEQLPAAVHRSWRNSTASVRTGHLGAQRALDRGLADLRLLVNTGPAEDERYISAGVPWFCTLFGRDALITALQLLAFRPQVAADTLAILARLQATEVDEWRDAEPGKILHELRTGELARTTEIPHSPYYGSVDATPLWLLLLDEYHRWTADDELVAELWPNALAALRWLDEFGDRDGDGFVEYQRSSRRGLANQGWKDSFDAIRGADGTLASGPIALVEVQAYVFAARRGLARLARLRGDTELAAAQETAAELLRERFESSFWMDEAGTYALALDGDKRQVDAIASNAGHVLWCGIASPERASRVARTLTSPPLWSGWGIRTLSSANVGYNPIGYHLGTVWPHDNAICAAGFARYGLAAETRQVAGAMLEATTHFRDARLPELFCGFDRASSPYPVPYPVACSPQAWAAGAPFQVITAALGMRPDAGRGVLELVAPVLPEWLPDLRLHDIRVGRAVVDLHLSGHGESVAVEVLRRNGDLDVVIRHR
jgi:glycogen debranching enzyme